MIQEIRPHRFSNAYCDTEPGEGSRMLFFSGNKVLCRREAGEICFPKYEEIKEGEPIAIYLFSVDEQAFYLVFPTALNAAAIRSVSRMEAVLAEQGYAYEKVFLFRCASPKEMAFAGITAYHLYGWYQDNRFCGRCGHIMKRGKKERMLYCTRCRNQVYPRISPAVIVAVTSGDRILMTKYAGRDYKDYALVAGFAEIGETLEETVAREVLEETGIRVKNIRYYKSQPWSFTGTMLAGFFAEADGPSEITLDKNELACAEWVSRENLRLEDDGISLTREMVLKFKDNGV